MLTSFVNSNIQALFIASNRIVFACCAAFRYFTYVKFKPAKETRRKGKAEDGEWAITLDPRNWTQAWYSSFHFCWTSWKITSLRLTKDNPNTELAKHIKSLLSFTYRRDFPRKRRAIISSCFRLVIFLNSCVQHSRTTRILLLTVVGAACFDPRKCWWRIRSKGTS